MRRKSKHSSTPFRNRSHCGWWVASYVERFEWADEDKRNPIRRCLAWENTILVKARNREEAYRKAIGHGRVGHRIEAHSVDKKRKGVWLFEGLTDLLPIYDESADGSEILWRVHRGRTVKRIKEMVRSKDELVVFDDSEL
jgi:hypothetical protein